MGRWSSPGDAQAGVLGAAGYPGWCSAVRAGGRGNRTGGRWASGLLLQLLASSSSGSLGGGTPHWETRLAPPPTFLQFGGQRKLGQEEEMEAAWADSREDREVGERVRPGRPFLCLLSRLPRPNRVTGHHHLQGRPTCCQGQVWNSVTRSWPRGPSSLSPSLLLNAQPSSAVHDPRQPAVSSPRTRR